MGFLIIVRVSPISLHFYSSPFNPQGHANLGRNSGPRWVSKRIRETSSIALIIPSTNPLIRAQTLEDSDVLFAALEFVAVDVDAFVIINIRLPAVLGLIGIRKSTIKRSRLHDKLFSQLFGLFLIHRWQGMDRFPCHDSWLDIPGS